MEKNKRKSKTPGSRMFGSNLDFTARLDRSHRIFQARMAEIFEKYNHPFDNDIIVNIEDLTYNTPEGRCPWRFETTMSENERSEDTVRKKQINDSDEPLFTRSKVDTFSGQTCNALTRYKEKNPDANDHVFQKPGVISKTIHIELPLKATVSEKVKRFININNKECFLKSPGRYTVVVCQADDSGPSDNEEASDFEPGNKTIADLYPQMIENLCSLWDFPVKNQVADSIVRYYKRVIWCKNKKDLGIKKVNRSLLNKTYTRRPTSNIKEISTAPATNNCTNFQEKRLMKSDIGEPNNIRSPSSFSRVQKFDSPSTPITFCFDSPSNPDRTFEGISHNRAIYMDSRFSSQQEINGVLSPGYHSRPSSRSYIMSISPTNRITNKSQMDIDMAQFPYCKDTKNCQQNIHPLSRWNSFSGFPISQSPLKVVAKPNCNMSEKRKTPNKAIIQCQMEVDERHCASYKDHTKQLMNTSGLLTRRNSFSAFPVDHRENKDFESLYRNLTQTRPQPFFSLGKPQVQLSKTVSSLVNSPGSLRAKRPISRDFSFSLSKKPRSVTEALITSKPSSHSVDRSDLLWSELNSSGTLQHSVVASALPIHMLSHSPVSRSSTGANGRSPTRTNTRIYRKLTYQEDNGTIAGN